MAKYVETTGLDMRTINPVDKMKCLLEGTIMIVSYILILVYCKELFAFFKKWLGHDLSTIIVGFGGMAFGMYFLLYRGFLRINFSALGGIPDELNVVKWYNKGQISLSNNRVGYEGIDKILRYVDVESSLSTREKASEMFVSSRSIVNSLSGTDERTLEYINAKLTFMTRESGFEYLKGKLR